MKEVISNPIFAVSMVLILGVVLVNGWTDAPNAIATAVGTKSIDVRIAIVMAGTFNFLGVFVMTMVNSAVAMTIENMVNFGDNKQEAIIGLSSALIAIVIWQITAWTFGIPTSESDALIAGLTGSAIAISGGLSGVNWNEWYKILLGLLLSLTCGFASGFFISKLTAFLSYHVERRKGDKIFGGLEIASSAGMAFMHGAQDGQKFMGIIVLGMLLINGQGEGMKLVPQVWMMLVVALLMAVGTAIGGKKIIKAVGMKLSKIEKYQGFAADFGAALCLFIFSSFGIPVSTTQTKTTAIMGAGASKRRSAVNLGAVKNMVLTWVFTFPGCGLMGFVFSKILVAVLL
jgi:PiT family inorganic phosphate transporter